MRIHGEVWTKMAALQQITTVIATYITEALFLFQSLLPFSSTLCQPRFPISVRRFIQAPHMIKRNLALLNTRNEHHPLRELHTLLTKQHAENVNARL